MICFFSSHDGELGSSLEVKKLFYWRDWFEKVPQMLAGYPLNFENYGVKKS